MQFVIATHGNLAEGYVDTIRKLTGIDTVHAVCAYTEEDDFPHSLVTLLDSFKPLETVYVFADLTGGSVCIQVAALMEQYPSVHLFGGVNLGLVLQLVLEQPEPTSDEMEERLVQARKEMQYLNTALK